jgi:hypothetical protein
MKKQITLVFLFFSFFSNAQLFGLSNAQFTMNRMFYTNGNPEDEQFYKFFSDNKSDVLAKEQVKSLKCSEVNKKGKETRSYELIFNKKGRVLERNSKNAKSVFCYLNDTLIQKIETQKGNDVLLLERSYNEINKLTFLQQSKNGKIIHQELYSYADNGLIIKSQIIDFKRHKTYEMHYQYSDTKKLKFQKLLVNGKVKKTWTYDCKEQGERVDTKKAALESVCRYEEQSSDGSYIVFSRQIKEGKDILMKNYFTKDSVFYMNETFKDDSLILHRSTIAAGETHYINYNKRQKVSYETIQKFNDDKQLLENSYLRKGKLHSKSTIVYNANGTISLYTRQDDKRILGSTNYSYSFY